MFLCEMSEPIDRNKCTVFPEFANYYSLTFRKEPFLQITFPNKPAGKTVSLLNHLYVIYIFGGLL